MCVMTATSVVLSLAVAMLASGCGGVVRGGPHVTRSVTTSSGGVIRT